MMGRYRKSLKLLKYCYFDIFVGVKNRKWETLYISKGKVKPSVLYKVSNEYLCEIAEEESIVP